MIRKVKNLSKSNQPKTETPESRRGRERERERICGFSREKNETPSSTNATNRTIRFNSVVESLMERLKQIIKQIQSGILNEIDLNHFRMHDAKKDLICNLGMIQ